MRECGEWGGPNGRVGARGAGYGQTQDGQATEDRDTDEQGQNEFGRSRLLGVHGTVTL